MKYVIPDKKEILSIIKGAESVKEGLIKLGISPKTKSNKRLRELIKEILIEDGTYIGKGLSPIGIRNGNYKSDSEFFRNGYAKRTTFSVRNALFSRGLKERRCERCNNTTWNNKPIPLEVHHKDGNKYNNEFSNLEILCPNCHYYTDTYKTKNITRCDEIGSTCKT